MTKKDKLTFIKSSRHIPEHHHNNLDRCTDEELDKLIREIVQYVIRESEIIADNYIKGYR